MSDHSEKRNGALKKFAASVWLFPAILTFLLILLTVLKISGSSIGIYHDIFYGKTKNPNLIINHPQAIRSDEWIVTTQLTIAQHAAGYPRINPNIDSGRDMSVVGDAPNKDWSTVFRPQNFSFFVLPLENAFAFKWWFLLYMAIVSCYFFTLRIFKDRRLFAAIFSSAIGLSPFLFWWYSTGAFGPIFYGLFIILLSIRIINGEAAIFLKRKPLIFSQIVYALVLAYLLMCFALILYPPFQIAIAIVLAFFIAGLMFNTYGVGRKLISRHALGRLAVFLSGIIIAVALLFVFLHTRSGVVSAITHTVYPGNRNASAEGSSSYEITSTFLQPQLQRHSRAINYYTNQSEASNFILLLPFMFIPGFLVLIAEYRRTHKLNWPLLLIQLCISLFLVYLFVPFFNPLYKLMFLNRVANVRLFIGLGLAGAIQLLLISKSLEKLNINRKKLNLLAGGYTLVCLALLAWVGRYARITYPEFIHSIPFIGFLAVFFCSILFCFLSRRLLLGATLLLLFTVGSVFHIHPLYRGLGPIYDSEVIKTIDTVSKPGDSWAVLDNNYYENFALMANRDSLSGIKPYPDLAFWRQVEGTKGDIFYNRYAHVIFSSGIPDTFRLVWADNFQVQFACTPFIQNHVKFALLDHRLELPCVKEVSEIKYPAVNFYIYSVSNL